MKRLYVTAVTAVAMLFSVHATTAQVTTGNNTTTTQQQTQQQDDFQQIQERELPNEVRQAVQEEYQGATIAEAHRGQKDGETKYKLRIRTQDGQSKEVYADADGNLKDKDDKDRK